MMLQNPALTCEIFVHAADRDAVHRSYELGGLFVFNPFETVLTLQIQLLNQYLSACQQIMKVWMPIVPSVVPTQTPEIMAASIPRRGSCIGPADLRS